MNEQEKAIVKEKKLEFWLGVFFLIPSMLGVIAFVLCLLDYRWYFSEMSRLSSNWTAKISYDEGGGGAMSAAPIYLGIMAMVGVYLIKNNARYIFMKKD
ncbi:uncharacterized protein BN697_01844 [Bacteroides sp. CAG:530]|nr:uncharacterized protein BN697_01844 [Bacteroides sp. CAG:530]